MVTVASLDADERSALVYERVGNEIISVPQPADGALLVAVGPLPMLKLPLVVGDSHTAVDRTRAALFDLDGDGRVDVLTGEGVHLQKRVSPSSVTPGVRALGRLPVLRTGLRSQAGPGRAH